MKFLVKLTTMINQEIIVVEDDLSIQEVIEILLVSQKYKLRICSTLAECEEHLSQITPDLLILDVMLPDGNGIDYCAVLKKTNRFSNLPVIIMSANAKRADASRAGAAYFIQKPFDIAEFRETTRRLLGEMLA